MKYYHVDVFSNKQFGGNGLTVFLNSEKLNNSVMQIITQEMRQFESIFLHQTNSKSFRAHIFTMEEELDFAGHPILGASMILHELYANNKNSANWNIRLNIKTVNVKTTKQNGYYTAEMNQGKPEYLNVLNNIKAEEFMNYLNLSTADKYDDLPLEVVSTGLPYLVVPVKPNILSKIKVTIENLEDKLEAIGANFFYIIDIDNLEGRTWDNHGVIEDVATGSAAGPLGAYLLKYSLLELNKKIVLKQGSFINRPSQITVVASSSKLKQVEMIVSGDVIKIANGEIISATNIG